MAQNYFSSSSLTTLYSSSSLQSPRSTSHLALIPYSPPSYIHSVDDAPSSPPPDNQAENDTGNSYRRATSPPATTQQAFDNCSASPPLPADQLYLALDGEMRQSFIGPVDIDTFFREFLPAHAVPSPSATEGFMTVARATSETDMYKPFVRLLT